MKLKVLSAFIALTLIWGASFLWIKIAVQELSPYMLVTWRLAFALVSLALYGLFVRPQVPRDARTWWSLVALSLLTTAVPWMLISWAEQTIDSALATVLNSTVPLFTVILAHFFLHDDRITPARVAGLAIAFAGVVLLALRDAGPTLWQGSLLGQGAMLVAALCYAGGTVLARRNLRHVSVLTQSIYSVGFSTVLLWLAVPFVEGGVPVTLSVPAWVAVLWLGVLGAGLASVLFYFVLHEVGPTRATLVTYTIPIVGVTLGVVVLKERLDWTLAVASVLIVAGVWVVNRSRARGGTNRV